MIALKIVKYFHQAGFGNAEHTVPSLELEQVEIVCPASHARAKALPHSICVLHCFRQ